MRLFLLFLPLLLVTTVCKNKQTLKEKQKELDIGNLDENSIYSVKEIGWSVKLPENWQVLSKRENYNETKKGEKFIEESTGTRVDASDLIELISIKKDQFNSFQSTMERYTESTGASYDDHIAMVHKIIEQAYKAKKIYADYELGATRIDGIMLDRFCTKIYSSNKKNVILQQKIFSGLINGYDFTMIINYNNESDEKTLMNIVNSTKFAIKK